VSYWDGACSCGGLCSSTLSKTDERRRNESERRLMMTQLETNAPKPPHPKPAISRAFASRAPDLGPDHPNGVEGEVEKSEHLIWISCPYPVVLTGVQKTLEKANYVCREPQGSVLEAPLAVIYYPTGEEVKREIRRLQDLVPTTPVLVVGDPGDLSLARIALQAGARGFMHTEMKPSQIVRALSLATKGELVVPRELVPGLIAGETPPGLLALTARQRDPRTGGRGTDQRADSQAAIPHGGHHKTTPAANL
jgi:hypothetical protein